MNFKLFLAVLTIWLMPQHHLAAETPYKVLATESVDGGTLRILRGPDINAARLQGIPFIAARTRQAAIFFPLRIEIASPDAGEIVLLHTLWPADSIPTRDMPDRYSGFDVLAVSADANGIVAVVAWIAHVSVIMVDSAGNHSVATIQPYGETERYSVDENPGAIKAQLSKSADGRWIITTTIVRLGTVSTFEQSKNGRDFIRTAYELGKLQKR